MNKHSPSTDTGDRGEGGGRAAGQEPEAGRVCVDKRDHERDHAATVIQVTTVQSEFIMSKKGMKF